MTTPITIVGNLTKDPELRFTPSGVAVCNLTVAVNERVRDQASGEWKDGEGTFYDVSVWNATAENVAESLTKGMRVIVMGGLKGRRWEGRDGAKGTSLDITVGNDGAVGPDLKWASAKVTPVRRGSGSQGGGQQSGGQPQGGWGGQQNNGQPQGGGQGGGQGGDPWGQPQGGGQQGGQVNDPWANSGDEPPF